VSVVALLLAVAAAGPLAECDSVSRLRSCGPDVAAGRLTGSVRGRLPAGARIAVRDRRGRVVAQLRLRTGDSFVVSLAPGVYSVGSGGCRSVRAAVKNEQTTRVEIRCA
jgi:hypothetical protein